jgi:hypothetical protein
MSGAERTGATEAQIEAAAKRYHVWESSDPDTYRPWEKLGRRTQECLKEIAEEMLSAAVPPGSRGPTRRTRPRSGGCWRWPKTY